MSRKSPNRASPAQIVFAVIALLVIVSFIVSTFAF
jgi:hypothetical protein